jgi:glucosylceramidase
MKCISIKFYLKDLNHWVTGWTDWNLALNYTGGPSLDHLDDSAILTNKTADEFYKLPTFYAMGHFR